MLLHASGRSLFSGQRAAGQAIHSAISDFVGVRPGTVTYHSPGDGHLERLSYRGAMIRGVIALADKPTDDSDTVVVFLDLRPVAAPVFFLSLATPRLTYDDLERLLPRPIPDGWKLTVQGGRRRATHLEVHHRCTLLFGLVSVSVPDPPPRSLPCLLSLLSQFATR